MMLITLAMAQGVEGVSGGQQGSFLVLLPMYLIIFAVFYLFLIRPQQKRQQEHQRMLTQLKKNDAVVTGCGIHGTVMNIKERTVVLKVDDNVKIEFDKNAVTAIEKSRKND